MITRVKPGANSRKASGRRTVIAAGGLIVALISLALLISVLRVITANTPSSGNATFEPRIIVETTLPGNVVSSLSSSDNSASYPQTTPQSGLSSDSISGSQDVVEEASPASISEISENAIASDAPATPSDLMSVMPPAQPFSLPALDGTTLNFPADYGTVTVFLASAPGCPSCVAEIPPLSRLQAEYDAHGLRVFVVDILPDDTPEFLQPFVDWLAIDNVLWVFDEGRRFSDTFNVMYLGTTIILDANGREVYRDDVISSEETLRSAIERVFAGG